MLNSICDVIKLNESELANTDFSMQPIIAFNFALYFIVLRSTNKVAIFLES